MSDIEFRYEIIVSPLKSRFFAKFMVPLVLFKKFLNSQFIAGDEV